MNAILSRLAGPIRRWWTPPVVESPGSVLAAVAPEFRLG